MVLKYLPLDFVFLDFGAGAALPILFKFYFERINNHGGYIMVHSTLTNAMHRLWLAELKLKYINDSSVDNEKDIRVVCSQFNQNYQHDNVYSLSAVFRRVYES